MVPETIEESGGSPSKSSNLKIKKGVWINGKRQHWVESISEEE